MGFVLMNVIFAARYVLQKAIKPVSVNAKKQIQIGIVKHIKGNCVVYTNKTECGACSRKLSTKAVYLVPWNGLHVPALNQDICVGCVLVKISALQYP